MSIPSPIVMVVDDDASVCTATRRLLRSAGYQVRTFASTQELFSRGRPDGPCCLVLDVQIPGEDGLQFQQRLHQCGIQVPIIFISGHGDIPTSVRAMKAGAVDFLPKPFDPAQFIAVVIKALSEDSQLLAKKLHLGDVYKSYRTLTSREREVFAAVATGMLNKQVAFDLGISEKTIKVHRGRVMEKMHATALADLVRMADLLEIASASNNAITGTSEMSVGTKVQ